MSDSQIEFSLHDAAATESLGAALARAYVDTGQGSAVVYLRGELGAGKTSCARSLLRTLGVGGAIRSPTYTLLEVYQPAGMTCVHADLYRLQGPLEVEELGLRDYFDSDCLLLVEWPERGGPALPCPDVEVTLSYRGDGRHGRVTAPSARGRSWLQILQLPPATPASPA